MEKEINKEKIRKMLEDILPLVNFDSDFLCRARFVRYHCHSHDIIESIWDRLRVDGCNPEELQEPRQLSGAG